MPKVSVIIPTYNRPHYVGEAINSVLGHPQEAKEMGLAGQEHL